jgi:hypothetical protein
VKQACDEGLAAGTSFQHTGEAEGQQHEYKTVKGCPKASEMCFLCIFSKKKEMWCRRLGSRIADL